VRNPTRFILRHKPCRVFRRKQHGPTLTEHTRLEAATSRLEDIAQSSFEPPQTAPGLQQLGTAPKPPAPTSAPPAPGSTATPQTAIAPSPPAAAPEPVPESIEEFDSFISQSLGNWLKLSNAMGGLVAEQAAKVVEAFKEQRKFLLITTKAKKPDLKGSDMSVFQDLLKPTSTLMTVVGGIKDANRGDKLYNNLCTVAESMMALAWVTLETKPFKHVEESFASAQFWGNKILTANKNK
jgi:adenylyl cyclase-associated protein